MGLLHKHDWIEKGRFYAPPVHTPFEVRFYDESFIERLEFGVTTILYKCSKCPGIKTVEIIGKEVIK